MKKRQGVIYGILVFLILIIGIWWFFFLTREGDSHAEFERQKLANDRIHAMFLLQTNEDLRRNPREMLGKNFPHLIFLKTRDGIDVQIDPVFLKAIEDKARSTRNMYLISSPMCSSSVAAWPVFVRRLKSIRDYRCSP